MCAEHIQLMRLLPCWSPLLRQLTAPHRTQRRPAPGCRLLPRRQPSLLTAGLAAGRGAPPPPRPRCGAGGARARAAAVADPLDLPGQLPAPPTPAMSPTALLRRPPTWRGSRPLGCASRPCPRSASSPAAGGRGGWRGCGSQPEAGEGACLPLRRRLMKPRPVPAPHRAPDPAPPKRTHLCHRRQVARALRQRLHAALVRLAVNVGAHAAALALVLVLQAGAAQGRDVRGGAAALPCRAQQAGHQAPLPPSPAARHGSVEAVGNLGGHHDRDLPAGAACRGRCRAGCRSGGVDRTGRRAGSARQGMRLRRLWRRRRRRAPPMAEGGMPYAAPWAWFLTGLALCVRGENRAGRWGPGRQVGEWAAAAVGGSRRGSEQAPLQAGSAACAVVSRARSCCCWGGGALNACRQRESKAGERTEPPDCPTTMAVRCLWLCASVRLGGREWRPRVPLRSHNCRLPAGATTHLDARISLCLGTGRRCRPLPLLHPRPTSVHLALL